MLSFNEILWISFLFIDMFTVLLIYYFWGRIGLFISVILSLIIANIQVVKLIDLFGLTTTLGNIVYASAFLATDILSELYSKKEAYKAVLLGFIALVIITLYMQIALLYVPAIDDVAQIHLEELFAFFPRITLASLCAYLSSQTIDVTLYHMFYHITKGNLLWFRNTASTLMSQFADTVIFTVVAFLHVYPTEILIELILTTYIFKAIIACADTPFIYCARYLARKRQASSYADVVA